MSLHKAALRKGWIFTVSQSDRPAKTVLLTDGFSGRGFPYFSVARIVTERVAKDYRFHRKRLI